MAIAYLVKRGIIVAKRTFKVITTEGIKTATFDKPWYAFWIKPQKTAFNPKQAIYQKLKKGNKPNYIAFFDADLLIQLSLDEVLKGETDPTKAQIFEWTHDILYAHKKTKETMQEEKSAWTSNPLLIITFVALLITLAILYIGFQQLGRVHTVTCVYVASNPSSSTPSQVITSGSQGVVGSNISVGGVKIPIP